MEREILFRGKRVDNGEWGEGDYVCTNSGRCFIKIHELITVRACNDIFEVIPETVGQYTGLTDKNGSKIFEGDIVKYIYEPGEGFCNANQTSVIVWDSTGFKMDGIMGTNKYALFGGWLVSIPCSPELFEVIGNIHDNPELMRGD